MKKALLIVFVCLFSLTLVAQRYEWKNVPIPNIKSSATFYDVKFISPTTGFIIGNNDTLNYVLKTVDGGYTWNNMASAVMTQMVKGCAIITENLIYVIGKKGSLYKTVNGGGIWTVVNLGTNADCNDISFPAQNKGYICTNGGRYINYDGGWSAVNVFAADNFIKVEFPTPTDGFLTASAGRIWRTIDGGATWDSIKYSKETLYGSHFLSMNLGYVVGPNRLVKRTVNGGQKWTDTAIFPKIPWNTNYHCTYFQGQNSGFVAGTNGALLSTIDGGTSWIQESVLSKETILKIAFSTNLIGFAVGTHGMVVKRTDVTSVNELLKPGFTIYPNPSKGVIHILSNNFNGSQASLEIFRITGEKVFSDFITFENDQELNLSGFQSGLYVISIKSDEINQVQKLFIE